MQTQSEKNGVQSKTTANAIGNSPKRNWKRLQVQSEKSPEQSEIIAEAVVVKLVEQTWTTAQSSSV